MATPVIDDVIRVSRSSPLAAAPTWAKLKGLSVGLIVEVPVFTAVLWSLGVTGILSPTDFVPLMRLVATFSGIAALVTAMGVGRTAAFASVEGGGGRWRSIRWACATHAVAGIGIAVIAAVAAGLFNGEQATWLAVASAGIAAGIICGAVIGLVCGGPSPISASDIMALAKRPTDMFVHAVIDPASGLVRMGGRVADRASHAASELVDGLFDPALPPPSSSLPSMPTTPAEPDALSATASKSGSQTPTKADTDS